MPFVAKPVRPVAPAVSATVNRPDINPPPRRRAPRPEEMITVAPAEAEGRPDDYVGYKHPPRGTRFQKGKSGNPKGRPKGAKGMKTIARQVLTEKVSVRTTAGVKRMTKMEALVHKNTELAFAGNIRALLACSALYQSAVADEVPHASGAATAPEITDTGRSILEMYAEEIRRKDRNKGNSS